MKTEKMMNSTKQELNKMLNDYGVILTNKFDEKNILHINNLFAALYRLNSKHDINPPYYGF